MTYESIVEISDQDHERLERLAQDLQEACEVVAKALLEFFKPIIEAIASAIENATRWLLERRLTRRLSKRLAIRVAWHLPWRYVPKRYLWRWARAQLLK